MVEIKLDLADGGAIRRRFVPGMGQTGFLISPYIEVLKSRTSSTSALPTHALPHEG